MIYFTTIYALNCFSEECLTWGPCLSRGREIELFKVGLCLALFSKKKIFRSHDYCSYQRNALCYNSSLVQHSFLYEWNSLSIFNSPLLDSMIISTLLVPIHSLYLYTKKQLLIMDVTLLLVSFVGLSGTEIFINTEFIAKIEL